MNINLREFYENKNVLIINADSEIGVAVSRELSKYRTNLFLTSRKVDVLDRMEKEIINARAFRADIREEDSIRLLTSRIDREYGDLDIIINLSEYKVSKPFSLISKREVTELVKVNIESAIMLVQYVLRYFSEKDKGCYVQKSSLLPSKFSADNAAKAAVSALCKSLRREYHDSTTDIVLFSSTSDYKESAVILCEQLANGKDNIVAGNLMEKGIGLIDTLYEKFVNTVILNNKEN